MSRQPVSMTLNRGVLWFEDGTEVSNVSVELLKAAPELLGECERTIGFLQLTLSKYFDDEVDPVGHLRGHVDDAVQRISKVVSKAKGLT